MIDLNGRLRLHESLQQRIEYVGCERMPILVIDNFLQEPHLLIDYAAEQGHFTAELTTFYPGKRAPMPPIYPFAVRALLGQPIDATFELQRRPIAKELSHLCVVTTRPEQLRLLQRIPHFDTTDEQQLAVLHYLSPTNMGGTSFYRHRRTGFETIRRARLAEYSTALDQDLAQYGPPAAQYIGGDTAAFERIASFEGVFNRLLVYRSICLHSADVSAQCSFDPNPRAGRLTANTFFFVS